MIDSQALHVATLDQVEDQAMRVFEQPGQLHPQRGKLVDIEKTTIIDLLRSDPPIGDPVGLRLKQSVQSAEARRLTRLAREALQRGADRRGHGWFASALAKSAFQLGRALPRPCVNGGEFTCKSRKPLPAHLENVSVRTRRNRK